MPLRNAEYRVYVGIASASHLHRSHSQCPNQHKTPYYTLRSNYVCTGQNSYPLTPPRILPVQRELILIPTASYFSLRNFPTASDPAKCAASFCLCSRIPEQDSSSPPSSGHHSQRLAVASSCVQVANEWFTSFHPVPPPVFPTLRLMQ
jgi:hypothetical protein